MTGKCDLFLTNRTSVIDGTWTSLLLLVMLELGGHPPDCRWSWGSMKIGRDSSINTIDIFHSFVVVRDGGENPRTTP
jgi:hypothetical protein